MSVRKNAVIVEAKVLNELQRGSYEELLQSLDALVNENKNLFGDRESALFASYQSHMIVMNEDGKFFRAAFSNNDGIVSFGSIIPIDVTVLSENSVVSQGVDTFLEGGSLADGLRGAVSISAGHDKSLMQQTHDELNRLFSGGQIWRSYVSEHKDRVQSFSWDADYGALDLGIEPMYAGLLEGDDADNEDRKSVIASLLHLERRLSECLSGVESAYGKYQESTTGTRDDETDEILSKFESFAFDYIEHLVCVSKFVSGAITEGKEGCILCTALVHDEIANRFQELELGGRFVRKVSAQLMQ